MMKIKMNLKGSFKLVPEGERTLKITKAECTPSGKPDKMKVTFQDSEGGFINTQYSFDNDGALYQMSILCSKALDLKDGEEFDTKTDTSRLIGKTMLCEVKHTLGTKTNNNGEYPTFANIKRIISLVNNDTGEVEESPRNSIASEDDLD